VVTEIFAAAARFSRAHGEERCLIPTLVQKAVE